MKTFLKWALGLWFNKRMFLMAFLLGVTAVLCYVAIIFSPPSIHFGGIWATGQPVRDALGIDYDYVTVTGINSWEIYDWQGLNRYFEQKYGNEVGGYCE